MVKAVVITPVKNSPETTLTTIKAITGAHTNTDYTVYNDFSNAETKEQLENFKKNVSYNLVNLEDITNTPSPNYKLVLQIAQKEALEKKLPLIVVESDVTVQDDTFSKMLAFYDEHSDAGLIGAVTTDEQGAVNFPYLKFRNEKSEPISTKRSLSFCCTLFSKKLLETYDLANLDNSKDWYDTFLSYKSIELGFKNYLLMNVPVKHIPHGSRPWKQLKYTNPIKYYFLKFLNRRDKI